MKTATTFRNYARDDVRPAVRECYREMRARQTVDYVARMHDKYLTYDRPLGLWEALAALDDFVDLSDPDMDLPNVQHLLQTAAAMRADDCPDWMQLVGLVHDLGKVLYLWGSDADGTGLDSQWGLVGDTFVVGCALPDSLIFPEFNHLNPDMADPRYNTLSGVYAQNCGLDACTVAWGHDEYLYQVLAHHADNRLPEAGMVMIRYHSLYAWHERGAWAELTNARDDRNRDWVRQFNRYDLYTKSAEVHDLAAAKAYFGPIIDKYLGTEPIRF